MEGIYRWLSNYPVANFILLVVYYLAVVLPHKRFGAFLNDRVFVGITRDQYNHYVLLAGILGWVIYMALFFRSSKTKPYRTRLWFYMAINTVLAVLIINLLFVINIEIVHLPQYALFAVLLFPLVRNYNATLFWATVAGAVDEAYQYFVLAPNDTGYFDFNDVVTNLVGAVFGLLLLRSIGIDGSRPFKSCRLPVFGFLLFLGLAFGLLYITAQLSIYPSDQHAFQLVKKMPAGFWSTVYPDVTYHVIRPLEGMVITTLLLLFYQKIGDYK